MIVQYKRMHVLAVTGNISHGTEHLLSSTLLKVIYLLKFITFYEVEFQF